MASQKIFLPSACGGKANCGQCKIQVLEGGGTILPTEVGFFNRKQIKSGYRLGCQVKIKDNLKIQSQSYGTDCEASAGKGLDRRGRPELFEQPWCPVSPLHLVRVVEYRVRPCRPRRLERPVEAFEIVLHGHRVKMVYDESLAPWSRPLHFLPCA